MDKRKTPKQLFQRTSLVSKIPYSSIDWAEIKNVVEYLRENKTKQDYFTKTKTFATTLLSSQIKDDLIATWLKQFKDNILFLEKENEEIVDYLLRFDWIHRSPSVITMYQELMLNLVSAHAYYLRPLLEMLIKLFTTGENGTEYVTTKEKELFGHGHCILKGIVTLVPMSPNVLCVSLAKRYPYVKKDVHMHVCYITNILEICTYVPSHRQSMMEDLIMKLLQFDVLCPRHQIEMDELDNSDVDEKTFPMDCDGSNTVKDNNQMSNRFANTLDVLMDCFIQHIQSRCFKSGSKELDWEETKKIFKETLALFDKFILPTHGSSHVQFILFYICSLKPDLHEAFIDYLWKRVQNPNSAPTLRQAAMFYIGSFLARAAYVTVSTVAVCLDLMCRWIHQYIDSQCYRNYADVSAHGTFYTVCQAVFYIFAFHHKKLVEMKNGHRILQNLNFERIISCRMNPLKVCLPAIVQNFASITRSYQLAYCYTVIEKNNRNLISRAVQTASGVTEAVNLAILHTIFPFDPYLLKRSKKWIQPFYRVYDAKASEDMDDQEEEFMLDDHKSPPRRSYTCYGSSLSSRPLYSPSTS